MGRGRFEMGILVGEVFVNGKSIKWKFIREIVFDLFLYYIRNLLIISIVLYYLFIFLLRIFLQV